MVTEKKKPAQVKRILVIDDNEEAAQALGKLFLRDGYDVALAFDGNSAIAIATVSNPDAVILDINLPGKNGYEVAHILRQMDSSMLLIGLTGYYGRDEHKRAAHEAGFDHYLTKPILASEIEKLFPGLSS